MTNLDIVLATVKAEVAGPLDLEQLTRVVLRLSVALLLGAAIGWDRERRAADAGLRTHMLVALGSALVVVVASGSGMGEDAMSRIIQGLVSGIGFLGAGAVLKDTGEGRIHGLTTAGSIWATAAVGITAGLGHEATALLGTIFVLVVLAALRRLTRSGTASPAG